MFLEHIFLIVIKLMLNIILVMNDLEQVTHNEFYHHLQSHNEF